MICHLTENHTLEAGQPSATMQFMTAMSAAGGAPNLSLLATAIAQSQACLPGVVRTSIIIDTENAAALDSTWDRREEACLVVEQDAEPHWIRADVDWSLLVELLSEHDGQLVGGVGVLPGGLSLDDETKKTNETNAADGAWCIMPLQATQGIVAVVVWQSESGHESLASDILELAQAIELVTLAWARASTQATDLAGVRRESQSLKRLNLLQGRFVAMASHEFKTPLTSITAYTDVLTAQLTDAEFPHANEFLGVIKSEADRLLRMVNRILDFTRIEYGSDVLARQATDLQPLVAETVRGLRPAINEMQLQVSVSSDHNLPRAEVDADLIRQVLVNLIGNAVKYSPRGGAIVINLREMESAVSVSVLDNGPGIATDDIRRIFREFYRGSQTARREPGSGLGLTIARHIVNLHGGHIEARQRESGGSDFRFLVPKEIGSTNTQGSTNKDDAQASSQGVLVDELLRLFAELTGSRAVSLLLRDGQGAMIHVGSMGWQTQNHASRPVLVTQGWHQFMHSGTATTELGPLRNDLAWCPMSQRRDENMFAPLGSGDEAMGVVITGRRRDDAVYSAADLVQLDILADVAYIALKKSESEVGRAVEAVRLLLKIRRAGVPTSTPQALDLLARLAHRFDLAKTAVRRIQYAAALHDAGMGRVEEEIVLGGSTLTVDEHDEVDRHVEHGVDLMAPLLPDEATADIIRHHHEMYDGSGFPEGLAGSKIPLGSRLLAVIDAWFALTRERPYRQGMTPEAAMQEIASFAGTQFDPKIVHEFSAVLMEAGELPVPTLDQI